LTHTVANAERGCFSLVADHSDPVAMESPKGVSPGASPKKEFQMMEERQSPKGYSVEKAKKKVRGTDKKPAEKESRFDRRGCQEHAETVKNRVL